MPQGTGYEDVTGWTFVDRIRLSLRFGRKGSPAAELSVVAEERMMVKVRVEVEVKAYSQKMYALCLIGWRHLICDFASRMLIDQPIRLPAIHSGEVRQPEAQPSLLRPPYIVF